MVRPFFVDREENGKRGAFSFDAFNGNRSSMPLHNPQRNGKAQAGSLTDGLCGEKGIEYAIEVFLRDAFSRIGYGYF